MKPKVKSKGEYFIAFLLLVLIVFLSVNAGMAWTDKEFIEEEQGLKLEGLDSYNLFMERLEIRLRDNPFKYSWNDNIKTALMWGSSIWLLITLSYFGSKRNYITGKEYGTAEWGREKDISDLFAENIMKKEIKRTKRVTNPVGRVIAKNKALKECEANNIEIKNCELVRLEEWKKENLPDGKWLNKESRAKKKAVLIEYKKQIRNIENRAELRLLEMRLEAWKPNKLKLEYQNELTQIEEEFQRKIIITNKKQMQQAQKSAKKKYQKGLKTFYSRKGKIQKIKNKFENADALFTKTERVSIYNYVLNNNTLILGGSGSGKTRGFVMPNILQAHSSFVITDPKGEILEKAGYFLSTVKGYKIRVLNLDDKSKSDGYNPFVYIHPERQGYEERVLSLIETIIVNTDGGEKKGGSDPFWDKAERLFLQAIFFFTCDGFVPEEQNMNTVNVLIKMLDIGEEEDNKDSDLDYFVKIFKDQHGPDHIGVQQYEEFRQKASGKTAKSIVISAVARLAPFKASEVRRIFSYDTMNLGRVGEEYTAVFVVVPPTDTTFNFIAGMLFTQMFQELQHCATQVHKHDGQRLPVPVRFILDEFANTCTIPQFTKILAYARSFGIGIVPILQSLEQIKNMYKDEWGVIVDNCNTLLFLGSITHMDTLEYMSKLLGKGTFDKKTTGRTRGRSGSSSQNFDVIGRELMDTAEIRKLPKENCLFVVGGRNPFYSEKYEYTSHPNYKYTSDASKAFAYDYTPSQPKIKNKKELEINHGEDEIKERASAQVGEIMERIDKEIDEIQMNFNVNSTLNRLGQDFNNHAPIRDELLMVDDGTVGEYDEMLLEVLDLSVVDKKVEDIMLNVKTRVEQVSVNAEEKSNSYSINTSLPELAKNIVSTGTNLVPIRDELLMVNDGTVGEKADETLDGFIFDDDENKSKIESDVEDLSFLIDEVAFVLNEVEEEAIA